MKRIEMRNYSRLEMEALFYMRVLKLDIRATRTGSSTRNIVFGKVGEKWQLLYPTYIRRSKSGTHGEETYILPAEYIIVRLYTSNSGHRDYKIVASNDDVKEKLAPILEKWKQGFKLMKDELLAALQ